jgi:symplekin
LHLIDSNICDLKTIINATSLCFSEKQVYTQDILINVLQTLVEVNPIPTLFMRTCIQTLSIYPKLSTFIVNNILQKLLIKQQIWLYPKVWEGFIKCCQRTKPISFNLLIQLPIAQLKEVVKNANDLKDGLQKYIRQLNPMQRAQIQPEVILTIEDQQHSENDNDMLKAEPRQ